MTGRAQRGSVATQALARIKRWGRGRVFVPKDFLDLGQRGAVDTALHRLTKIQVIRPLGRGLYDYPKVHERLGPLTPSIDDVVAAVRRSTGETIVVSGAAAANSLRLSTQVPARPVYLTNGTSRKLSVGTLTIWFRHAAPSRMAGGNTMAGLALRALRFLGRDGVGNSAIDRLRAILTDSDRSALQGMRRLAPSWLQPFLDRIVDDEHTQAA